MKFGEYLKRQRIEVLGETLRGFCRKRALDPGNLSKIERGRMFPGVNWALSLLEQYGFPKDSTEARAVYMREQTERTGVAFGED